jgi:hypothetical protein
VASIPGAQLRSIDAARLRGVENLQAFAALVREFVKAQVA